MMHAVPILLGALFTVATAWSMGLLLLSRIAAPIYIWERRLLAFVVGSACLSEFMFALSAARMVYRGVLLAAGAAAIVYAVYSRAFRSTGKAFPPLSITWRWAFIAVFGAFTGYGFFNALAPEHSSDGMAYHLAEVLVYRQAHGFPRITTDVYANLSQGIELLYFFAFDFGRHSAAALVHYTFLIALAFLAFSYGRRIGRPAVGIAGALFTYTCPVILRDATTAYIDVALAAVLFGLFYLLQIWDDTRDARLLAPIGILAGFGYAVKYTAFLAVPYALGFVLWKLWRARKPLLGPALVIISLAAAMFLPWMLKDWIEVANPFSPLANRLFPNPYVHISFEDSWRRYLSLYTLNSRWQIPLEVTIRGGELEGFLGPLFLLTPLALLSLRFREGRQLLLAALLFASTYFTNIGTRFLIPVVPFVAIAVALAIAKPRWLLVAFVAADALVCWPGMYLTYCTPGAWRIEGVPVQAALRIEPEDQYLSQDPDYNLVRMIGRVVPPGQEIFAIGLGGRSYLPRQVLIGYQGGANEVAQDILWTPVVTGFQPVRILRFNFRRGEFGKLRVVQQGRELQDQWSMDELRVFDGPRELPRDAAWRLTARPNPWDVQLAFDNSPVTRWRSWQPAQPGMYVEVDFGRMQTVSSVVVESSWDTINAKIALQGMGADGKWAAISDHPLVSARPIEASLRMAATAELKARGIRYVLIRPGDFGAGDFARYPQAWGVALAGELDGIRLYRIL
jgi:Dolichyl-phosphate-mannose-protein mannosyltransferase